MQFAYLLGGGAPVVKRYVAGVNIAEGIPVAAAIGDETGVQPAPSTTDTSDMLGLSVDAVTNYSTTQSTDGSDIEAEVSVIINPNAVFRARLSGGATTGTSLQKLTVTTASTDGLSVITDTDIAGSQDEGVIWGYSGANAGLKRKITAQSSGDYTIVVPFHDVAVGDVFLAAPVFPGGDAAKQAQLTSDFKEINSVIAVATGADFVVVGGEFNDASFEGDANSWAHIMSTEHMFGGNWIGN